MTTNSAPLGSDATAAFELLHPDIQRWIYREGWTELRDIQGDAIFAIVNGGVDVLISAPTAAGKTEAAFLPLLSRVLDGDKPGIRILYVGPLKALINDQFGRLEKLCEDLAISVNPWHGDVSANQKERVRKAPSGVVLITPESLEALFVNHGGRIPGMFSGLEAIVVDETHSFVGTERGAQLRSLLHRLESTIGRRVDRIGLSATLGDPGIAAEYLRPKNGAMVRLVQSGVRAESMRALIVGIEGPSESNDKPPPYKQVGLHIYARMRGKNNLVFANSRGAVEQLGDYLVQQCEQDRVPVEFGAHHGSLSKELRFEAEARLKAGQPFTAVCTNTLEMGIDIGSMASIGQVGVPPSVSSLRQRTGRSGRRAGEQPTLWMYSIEEPLAADLCVFDRLRVGLFQQAAMLDLMALRRCEPPKDTALHLSTLIQQCLSVVAQRGGITPKDLFDLLCRGPFGNVDRTTFVRLLRDLGEKRVLVSAEDNTLLAGELGEKMLAHYSFYAAFATPEEYRIVCDGRTLGTLPIDQPLEPKGFIIFAARRWRILEIYDRDRLILVERASAGRVPRFNNDKPFGTHGEVRRKMKELYEKDATPPYLDAVASELFIEGQTEYRALGLETRRLFPDGADVQIFLWEGDYAAVTLGLAIRAQGFNVSGDGLALEVHNTNLDKIREALHELFAKEIPPEGDLVALVPNKQSEKHDSLLSEESLGKEYAAKILDRQGAHDILKNLVRSI